MQYFFSGLGGAGALPLAFILQAQGHTILWSDRARDQGQNPGKFSHLESLFPQVWPQDGSGIRANAPQLAAVIPSGAVEADVPDLRTARELGVAIIRRPEMLSSLFNAARIGVAVAGTSGKTTVTGMIGYLLSELGENPTVMNGGVFRNYAAGNPWCTALTGRPDLFVTEADESDGSIDLYRPKIGVVTNVGLDHKSLEELEQLFGNFIARCPHSVLNFDDPLLRKLAGRGRGEVAGFSFDWPAARLQAQAIELLPDGSRCKLIDGRTGETTGLRLMLPGRHNIANALAALTALLVMGAPLDQCAQKLGGFTGIKRRLELIGTARGVTVIDDFAHNPDKISASLAALRAQPGRLLILFQPHGFGPLRLMRHELVEAFAQQLAAGDELFVPEPFYAGGTVDRSVGSRDVVADLTARGITAKAYPHRDAITPVLLAKAKAGDRLVVMGARDDTLADYACSLLAELGATPG